MSPVCCDSLEEKVFAGERLTREEGRSLLQDASLLELGQLANSVRSRHNPDPAVTFVIDSNPNYTNVCITDCVFCAFYRKPGSKDGYVLTVDQVMEKVRRAVELGATTVLLQGGHNPQIPLSYYLALVSETRRRFPQVTPHFFTASEVTTMAQVSGLPIGDVLRQLKDAGQSTLPGGGAEILSDRIRRRLSPKKGGAEAWLSVHREAHRLGFKSTATMMFGHLEDDDDLLQHLEHIRGLQDETRGFTAFIPWSFKPGNTPLEKPIPHHADPTRYLRIIALSRLYLDNVPHIQASWFSEGKKTGQVALHFGADDFGGTLFEENVHAATNFINTTSVEDLVTVIREAGFRPVQRTTLYERIKEW
ncbi:MAG: dehypoxanthine futalosine cyclase [Omnitrophica WOR_2 bacterium RIFCSPLOWO2_02_FULL_63_16]|nr:MAG: dehypoxanthine futalosine cyclase [Omnitrophica WOR_2 bacterium GWA2_63_20]OGX33134.1 MAG: dehypoxanthine futalosine cyclase [Omnitrophica WOR_2 bacterium RIFCSPHIGHO2_12_FULL_64_13]OGX46512.1 MAG: dehypoxanthine futalosine cyclase [Omnitrophica WOR_2 bacterium RIFCSPLOWO2_02_FULL_63_16]OGX47485.1 MAG: dehypoxanthine futalosine cyclase [Omnitrophica WOR_2 bacterium RIFCSPLOWO2_12_FULL_63_16]HAM39926.1 dehypoxanthine futalosine cyclase [Candidatus Omnitrophota bacterium]